MCHRSQAADRTIKDLTKVYDEGDLVKAIVLKVNRLSGYEPCTSTYLPFYVRVHELLFIVLFNRVQSCCPGFVSRDVQFLSFLFGC